MRKIWLKNLVEINCYDIALTLIHFDVMLEQLKKETQTVGENEIISLHSKR